MERIFKIEINNQRFTTKPTPQETAIIQNNFELTNLTIKSLRDAICLGKTVKPAIVNNESGLFVSQSAFFIDVDNNQSKRSIKENIKICEKMNLSPNIIYRTFSGNFINQRHRMVFLSNCVITDLEERNFIQEKLIEIFAGDKIAGNINRIFYGGNLCYFFNPFLLNNFDTQLTGGDLND